MTKTCSTLQQSTAPKNVLHRIVTEKLTIPHTSYSDAVARLGQCFEYASGKCEAEGLAIVGESGTGKTTVLRSLLDRYPSTEEVDGDVVPILFATVPSSPTVKSFAGVLLEALRDPLADKGTENDRTRRLRRLMRETRTRMVMIDEAQHFVDRKNNRVIQNVANWLKILIDDTKTTLVIAGLPSCLGVLSQNEQLARRFLAPVTLPRFNWNQKTHRCEFLSILRSYGKTLGEVYSLPEIHSADFGFRMWKATGGLMGYLAKLLRQLERNAARTGSTSLTLKDFSRAYKEAICTFHLELTNVNPFDPEIPEVNEALAVAASMQLGTPVVAGPSKRGPKTAIRKPSMSSVFSR